jgi:Immunity protein 50
MEPYEFIEGHERVIAHLGLWPSFHDAEVFKLELDRTKATTNEIQPVLNLHLRGWVMTSEIISTGHFKLIGDALFHFKFEGINDLQINGFNGQNVISSLNLELGHHPDKPERNIIKVELEHCYLFDASFTAERAHLVSITPYEK